MGDLKSVKLMYLKAGLFLLGLAMAVAAILLEHFSWKLTGLLAVVVWFSARLYYFLFYVIGHYVDPSYKFSGIGSFLAYLWRRRGQGDPPVGSAEEAPTEDRQADL